MASAGGMFRGAHLNDGQFIVIDWEITHHYDDPNGWDSGIALLLIPNNPDHPYSTHRFNERDGVVSLYHGDYCETIQQAVASFSERYRKPSHDRNRPYRLSKEV